MGWGWPKISDLIQLPALKLPSEPTPHSCTPLPLFTSRLSQNIFYSECPVCSCIGSVLVLSVITAFMRGEYGGCLGWFVDG
jgi:hypothetical protein